MNIQDIILNRTESFYDNLPDAVIVLDFMRNIILWNKRAELIFGYNKSEIKNKNITVIFPEDYDKLNKITGLTYGNILKATTKNGDNIFVDVTAHDAFNSSKTIVSIRALSNKFLELQNLLDNYQETKMLVSNRDSFLSSLKLDFLTPVNAAIGFSQSLLENICGDLNEKQQKYIEIINSNNKKLKILMEKVFETISLDADTKEFNFKNFDFLNILEHIVDTYKNNSDIPNKINVNIDTDKRKAFSDEYAFAEVVDILINNAIKFGEKTAIEILVHHPITEILEYQGLKIPTGYNEKSFLQIDISDEGTGISQEKSQEIFDEYSSKNLATAQKNGGTALSLPIAKKIIHKLNGALWYSSNKNNGSIFSLIIPIEKMTFD